MKRISNEQREAIVRKAIAERDEILNSDVAASDADTAMGLADAYAESVRDGDEQVHQIRERANLDHYLRAPVAAGSQAVQVPGWKLVPIEPTAEMLQAGQDAQNRAVYAKPQPAGAQWGDVYYRAMVQAAPLRPLAGGEVL